MTPSPNDMRVAREIIPFDDKPYFMQIEPSFRDMRAKLAQALADEREVCGDCGEL